MTDKNYQKNTGINAGTNANQNPKASNPAGGQQNPLNPTKQPWKEKGTPPGQKGQNTGGSNQGR